MLAIQWICQQFVSWIRITSITTALAEGFTAPVHRAETFPEGHHVPNQGAAVVVVMSLLLIVLWDVQNIGDLVVSYSGDTATSSDFNHF